MELITAFQSTIIYLIVGLMSAFNINPDIKVAAVETTAQAVVMALRSSQIPITYENIEHDLRKDTISINNIRLQVPISGEGWCGQSKADQQLTPSTIFYNQFPCSAEILIGDITVHGLRLSGDRSETTSIQVNRALVDLSSFDTGQMLVIKKMLKLGDTVTIENIAFGVGYDLASDKITSEFELGVEGLGSIEASITVSSIREHDSYYNDIIVGQLDRVDIVITDQGVIETASMLMSIDINGGTSLSKQAVNLFASSPLSATLIGDLTDLYPQSDQNISELARFLTGNMTFSCTRENPHQLIFSDELFTLGPTGLFNLLCENVVVSN